ncbi:hypothetical protein GPECTOR_29g119 [Gonium pectorale]|uniref:Cupin-like domain-containing protein n=1 Tax=Gonium pectorale TaxID=33097 RepID=A0A150GEK9_GONPE|nr:hypothetical protein GPECTOR_29g119 [Gonium pectorale]|eukprot:KXZ48213.1 hypothetical protein GPECTOR_29g119 [Gonium pectorale]
MAFGQLTRLLHTVSESGAAAAAQAAPKIPDGVAAAAQQHSGNDTAGGPGTAEGASRDAGADGDGDSSDRRSSGSAADGSSNEEGQSDEASDATEESGCSSSSGSDGGGMAGGGRSLHVYLAQQALSGGLAPLLEDAPTPACLAGKRIATTNLWMCGGSVRSSLHYDPHHNLLAVACGRKAVTLIPPHLTPCVYPMTLTGGVGTTECKGGSGKMVV